MQWFAHQLYSIQDPAYFVLALVIATLLFVAVVWALHQLPPVGKKWLTISCTFVAGLFFIIEYFWPVHANPADPSDRMNWLTPWVDPVSDYVTNIMVWTLFLGIISLVVVHGTRLVKGRPGWHNSLAFFLAMISIAVAGFMSHMGSQGIGAHLLTSANQAGNTGLPISAPDAANLYNNFFYGLLINLDSAMFALLAFYIASAAYRAFRVRTAEAGLLMASALIIMLGFVNFGAALTHGIPEQSYWGIFRIEQFSQLILRYINMPTSRAVTIGVAVGFLAMSMRIWLSLERGAFFSQEQ